MFYLVTMAGFIIEQSVFTYFMLSLLQSKFSKLNTWLVIIINVFIMQTLLFPVWDKVSIRSSIALIETLVLVILIFKDKFIKKFLISFAYFSIVMLSEAISFYIGTIFLNITLENLNDINPKRIMWQLICYTILFLFSIVLVKILKRKSLNLEGKSLQYIAIYIATQMLTLLVLLAFIYEFKLFYSSIAILQMVIFIASLAVLFLMIKNIKINAVKIAEQEFLKEEIAMRDKHYNEMKTQYGEYKKLKHDFINHMITLTNLKNYEETSPYLEEMQNKINTFEAKTFSKNPVIDALLFTKNETAKELGIKMDIKIAEPQNKVLSDMDMCSIFANLIDNAISASNKFDGKEKHVKLEAYNKSGSFVIVCKNSSNAVSESLQTTKNDKSEHGLGLKIIKSIALKNKGDAIFRYENNEFLSIVTLKL